MKDSDPILNPHRHHCMVVFAPYPIGETRVQREAEALIRHGYEVDVICLRLPGEPSADVYKGVKIYREHYRVPYFSKKNSALIKKFLKYLRFFFAAALRISQLHMQKHYSSIQVHNLPDFLVFCTLLPKLQRVPVILDLHDLMPEFFAGRFGHTNGLGLWMIRLQERLACKYADHVITVSEHWRKALIQRGVPANKCSVVMNVADNHIFTPPNGNQNNRHIHTGFHLIYHGSIHQRYGLDLAVQAIDILRNKIPDIHLSLIGDGDFLSNLRIMIDQLQLQEYITIEELHLAEELPEIILSCDLGIVPYRNDVFTDGLLPTKLMEYAALGFPAIAARTTAIQAYFSGSNVEFFEPGNLDDLVRCILTLYHDPNRMATLARGSQVFNQSYNWAKISADYVALVDQLCKNQPFHTLEPLT